VAQQHRAYQRLGFGHRPEPMSRCGLGERVAHQEIEQHESADDVVVVVRLTMSIPVEIHTGRES
jgi:hypothetical protein